MHISLLFIEAISLEDMILGILWDIVAVKGWRKCMGIEPTRDGINAPHRI